VSTVTIVDGDRVTEVDGVATDAGIRLTPDALREATGWELRPEGLCRGDVCVPRRPDDGLVEGASVDVAAFAAALRRPIACEPSAALAVLGASAEDQADAFAGFAAPPFVLPDLDGRLVALTDFAARKKLLLAWSSW